MEVVRKGRQDIISIEEEQTSYRQGLPDCTEDIRERRIFVLYGSAYALEASRATAEEDN